MEKIYLIAGEASGDFIGSRLIEHLKIHSLSLEFVGVGGALMEKQGLSSLFPIKEINLFGFLEIIPHLFRLRQLINLTVKNIISHSPQILITIDSPGFTYRVAKSVRRKLPHLKIIHIVAPSVWAYRPSRAAKYAKIYDSLLVLLPFEPPYFTKVGLSCHYIGHPILEQQFYQDKKKLRQQDGILEDTKVICVTPGSRRGEIIKHMPIFYEALNRVATKYPGLQVIFVISHPDHTSLIKSYLTSSIFTPIFSLDRLKSFAIADAALAKSGTNTLEIAASRTPLVVAYRVNSITALMLKPFLKIRWVSLINIIAGEEVIPEFLQSSCNPLALSNSLIELLANPSKAEQQLQKSQQALKQLGFNSILSSTQLAAKLILNELPSKG